MILLFIYLLIVCLSHWKVTFRKAGLLEHPINEKVGMLGCMCGIKRYCIQYDKASSAMCACSSGPETVSPREPAQLGCVSCVALYIPLAVG